MTVLTEQEVEQRDANKALDAQSVVQLLRQRLPELLPYATIVGRWVWLETPEKPSDEVIVKIKVIGFNWNAKRRVWQHACGVSVGASAYDPRGKYQVRRVDDGETETPQAAFSSISAADYAAGFRKVSR